MIAQDFLNHDLAGLILVGRNDEGDYEWLGSTQQWRLYRVLSS